MKGAAVQEGAVKEAAAAAAEGAEGAEEEVEVEVAVARG